MLEPRKTFAIYAITRHGLSHAAKLAAALSGADIFVSEKLLAAAHDLPELARAQPMALPMGPLLKRTFKAYDCHVFIISVGAVVRMVAPLLDNKKVDPAVLCVDDAARFTICVLSGHVGRGNAFAERIAGVLASTPVITTASDVIGTLTVDILGRDLGFTLDDMDRNVTRGAASVVNSEAVLLVQETGEPSFWPLDKALPSGVRYTTQLEGVDPRAWEMLLIISDRDIQTLYPEHWEHAVLYRPKSLVLGIGCDRGTPLALIERGVHTVLGRHGLSVKSVRGVASVDKKSDEEGLLELARAHGWPLQFFCAEELDRVPNLQSPSLTVLKHIGTRGVAEPAARLAAGVDELVVPKTIYTEDGAGRSMTIAVARAAFLKRPEANS